MKKKLVMFGLAVVGALAVVRWVGGGGDGLDGSDPGLVLDRLWVDRLPEKPKDTFNLFAAITEQPIGVFQFASQWRGGFEMFTYTSSGGELRLVYPQTDDKEKVKARAWKCKQGEMDYCLELTGASRGVKRYYSQRGWEIDSVKRPEEIFDRAASIVRPAR